MQRGESGFTLIELVITSVVLSITFLAVFTLFGVLRTVNARANNLTVATEVAQLQIENYRNLPYSAISVGTTNTTSALANYPQLGASRSSSVAVSLNDARGLKKIDVTINYSDAGRAKQLVLSTLIALNGIDR
jgi:prepilin-type N-terminal cleavage/methylation domain-containing protein